MHDIRLIRDDPAAFDAALARRGVEAQADRLVQLDQVRRTLIRDKEQFEAERKRLSGLYGRLRTQGREQTDEALVVQAAAVDVGKRLKESEAQVPSAEGAIREYIAAIPNLPHADVPDGADEEANLVEKTVGTPPSFDFPAREHDALGPPLGMDFDTGIKLAGARFTLLRGPLARLNRALGQFMLTSLAHEGYEQVIPPLLVRDEVAFGTGQLPKFADDLFRTTDGRWLISTAEMSLTNIVREQILSEDELPLRFCALTPCFRSEAGAAGRDTRGMIRQHQFDKVEMVSIVTPDRSEAEHERMTACAEAMLVKLRLPFRRMKLCTGDMGFTAARTYDLEVWLPGQARYREISSCSTCTDFQARRMNARYRPAGEKATRFVHTLNGSGLAVGRTLVAVIENGQQADGSVVVPEVLRPYLDGVERLEPTR